VNIYEVFGLVLVSGMVVMLILAARSLRPERDRPD